MACLYENKRSKFGCYCTVTLRMIVSSVQFIIKLHPTIQFQLAAIVCAEIGNCTTAQPQVLKERYDPFFPSETSVYKSVMELARNNDSKTY